MRRLDDLDVERVRGFPSRCRAPLIGPPSTGGLPNGGLGGSLAVLSPASSFQPGVWNRAAGSLERIEPRRTLGVGRRTAATSTSTAEPDPFSREEHPESTFEF